MKAKRTLTTLCAALVALSSLSTAAAATEYVPCNYCSTQHAMYCGGTNDEDSGTKTHRYGLFWAYTCSYYEELHFSVADCPNNGTIWGSDHIYETSGHTYDDAGKNVCGQDDAIYGCI